MTANPEIAESLTLIEFDVESESFHATYDSIRDSQSFAVVAVAAAASEEDPQALSPLQTVIDTDALDKLTTEPATGHGTCDSILFSYEGFEVTITSEGVIQAAHIENA
ncbi:HalOD1 output domain-containing protein [Halosimplex sp. TS25]|uniref:HalOD1 output domain-containing protein n=1 Tax=Halosimplex rarum TaxID=3396619 RepID=UPI0039EB8BB6